MASEMEMPNRGREKRMFRAHFTSSSTCMALLVANSTEANMMSTIVLYLCVLQGEDRVWMQAGVKVLHMCFTGKCFCFSKCLPIYASGWNLNLFFFRLKHLMPYN